MFPDSPWTHHGDLAEIGCDEFFAETGARALSFLYAGDTRLERIIAREKAGRLP